jgi:epoxyqueuosine reductase
MPEHLPWHAPHAGYAHDVPALTTKADLIALALRVGFSDCRVAAAKPAAHRKIFEQWVAEGKYGDMAWMARNLERRTDPQLVLPGAKAVVVFALNYFQGRAPEGPLEGRIARYAWNEDYHDLIEKKLKEINTHLEALGGTQRYYVDTGPVLERDFASEAGLGWNGKSTMQIHRSLGTWFFLAEIITTLEIEPDPPAKGLCGKCTRCMVACPTQAITAPRRMDARRCISYLTIEHKGSIPVEFRQAIGDRIYGCDDCLSACPWNKFAQTSHEAAFQARDTVFQTRLRDMLALTDDTFRALFAKSPIKRIKRPAFLRNVCVALGNVGTAEDLPALEQAAQDENPLIAEHARWAMEAILYRVGAANRLTRIPKLGADGI